MYSDVQNKTIHSNQYSVTEHFKRAEIQQGQNMPGVFFFYDLSPIKVRSLSHWLPHQRGHCMLCVVLSPIVSQNICRCDMTHKGKLNTIVLTTAASHLVSCMHPSRGSSAECHGEGPWQMSCITCAARPCLWLQGPVLIGVFDM